MEHGKRAVASPIKAWDGDGFLSSDTAPNDGFLMEGDTAGSVDTGVRGGLNDGEDGIAANSRDCRSLEEQLRFSEVNVHRGCSHRIQQGSEERQDEDETVAGYLHGVYGFRRKGWIELF